MSTHSPITGFTAIKSETISGTRTLDMLTARTPFAAPHFLCLPHSPFSSSSATSITTHPSFIRHNFKPLCSPHPQSSIKISSTSLPTHFIEHLIFFKVKPDTDSSKVNAMINNLNSLVSLESVLHLSAGPILRNRSSTLTFTHMLHSRYSTKSDLISYFQNPDHVTIAKQYVHPIVEDMMSVDFVANDVSGPVILPPGSAFRATVVKLKENVGEGEKEKVLGVVGGIKEKFPGIDQFNFGENFSPRKAKGFSIVSIAVFKGVEELNALDNVSEVANAEKDKVRGLLDGVLVVDYVVPAS